MSMNLKPYYDAAMQAEARVREIAADIDALFTAGKAEDALAKRQSLEEAKASAKDANDLYLSMRGMGENDPLAPNLVLTREDDLVIGMSQDEIANYSLLRMIRSRVDGDRRAVEAAALEIEASQAMAEKLGRQPQGFYVPWDVLNAPRPRNTQMVGDPAYGGYLVQRELLADSFIDVLRNKMVTRAAGARTMTGLVGELDIPKKTAGATAYWIGEGNAPSKSTLQFGQVAGRPRTVAAYANLTRRFIKQSSLDAEMMVRDDLANTLALGLDLAGLHGAGSGHEPRGIAATTGIGSVIGGTDGAAPDWADIVNLETEVATDNADVGSLAYMTNAKVRGKLKQTMRTATYGEIPIWGDGAQPLNGYAAWVTNQVKSNLTKGSGTGVGVCSAIFYGNWADLIYLLWGGLDVLVDPYTGSTSGDVLITAMQDADVIVRRAQSFSAMLDALTT